MLDFFVPHFVHRIEVALVERVDPKKKDTELQFALLMLSECFSIRSVPNDISGASYILKYLDSICGVLDKTLGLEQKEEYELATALLQNTMHNLVHIRPLTERTAIDANEWDRDTFQWAKPCDIDNFEVSIINL